MKKVFFALAVVAMFSFAACNGNAEATDTNATEETAIVEENVAPEEEAVVEEGAEEAAECETENADVQ